MLNGCNSGFLVWHLVLYLLASVPLARLWCCGCMVSAEMICKSRSYPCDESGLGWGCRRQIFQAVGDRLLMEWRARRKLRTLGILTVEGCAEKLRASCLEKHLIALYVVLNKQTLNEKKDRNFGDWRYEVMTVCHCNWWLFGVKFHRSTRRIWAVTSVRGYKWLSLKCPARSWRSLGSLTDGCQKTISQWPEKCQPSIGKTEVLPQVFCEQVNLNNHCQGFTQSKNFNEPLAAHCTKRKWHKSPWLSLNESDI